MADIKINYTISIEGNVYLLRPRNNGEYYEVYAHSNDETFGDYVGDFESPYKLETLEFEKDFASWLKGEEYIPNNDVEKDNTIKWFKVKCSFYEREFGIKLWRDVVAFVDKHRCFDYEIKGQTTEPFADVDAEYRDGTFYFTK